MSKVDIMIFGATGWTGKYLVKHLATTYKNENITWAVAGRSIERLNALLSGVSKENSK